MALASDMTSEEQSWPLVLADRSPIDFGVAVVTLLFYIAYVPSVFAGFLAGRVALMVAVVPVGIFALAGWLREGDRLAGALAAMTTWLLATSAASGAPGLALLGSFNGMSSALILIGAVCLVAIARRTTSVGLDLVAAAALLGATTSGVLALVQVLVGPDRGPFALTDGRPDGLAGHPVYFAMQMLPAAGYMAWRYACGRTTAALVGFGVFAAAAGLSGARFVVLVIAIFVGAIAWTTRHQERAGRAALLAVVAGSGAVLSAILPHQLAGTTGSVRDRAVSAGGVSDRWDIWVAGIRGGLDRPTVGWGQGRFVEASQAHLPDYLAHRQPWTDAHNFLIEQFVAMGAVGVLILAAVVTLATPRLRPASRWMLIGIAVGALLEPLPPHVLGLAAVIVGVGLDAEGDRSTGIGHRWRAYVAVLVSIGVLLGGSYVIAHHQLDAVFGDPGAKPTPPMSWWLHWDPDTHSAIAAGRLQAAAEGIGSITDVVPWSERAAHLDPASARFAALHSSDLALVGEHGAARLEAERALGLQANEPVAIRVLAYLADRTADSELADWARSRLCEIGDPACS